MASYTRMPAGATSALAEAPAAGFRGFASRMSEGAQSVFAQQRSWGEVFARHSFGWPGSLADASSRIGKNVSYFRVNYFIFLLILAVSMLLWNSQSLIVIALILAAWAFLFVYRTNPLTLFGRTFTEKELVAIASLLTVVVVFLFTNVGSLLISTIAFGTLFICVHAAFRVPDDLFIDEEQASAGYLPFLGGNVHQASVNSSSRV